MSKEQEDQEYRRTGMLEDEFYDDEDESTDDSSDDNEHTDDDSQDDADEEHRDKDTSDEDTDGDDDGGDSDNDEEDDDEDGKGDDAATARFKALGLDKKYADVETALASIPFADDTITKATQDKAELMNLLVQSRQNAPTVETVKEKLPEIDAEDFLDDPIKALTKLGLLGPKEEPVDTKALVQDEVQRQASVVRVEGNYQKFVADTEDLDAMMPVMKVIYSENPGMAALPLDEGTKLLYQLAKARSGQSTSATTKKIRKDKDTEEKRSRANTSSTRHSSSSKKKRGKVRTEADLHKMSEDELENYLDSLPE